MKTNNKNYQTSKTKTPLLGKMIYYTLIYPIDLMAKTYLKNRLWLDKKEDKFDLEKVKPTMNQEEWKAYQIKKLQERIAFYSKFEQYPDLPIIYQSKHLRQE